MRKDIEKALETMSLASKNLFEITSCLRSLGIMKGLADKIADCSMKIRKAHGQIEYAMILDDQDTAKDLLSGK